MLCTVCHAKTSSFSQLKVIVTHVHTVHVHCMFGLAMEGYCVLCPNTNFSTDLFLMLCTLLPNELRTVKSTSWYFCKFGLFFDTSPVHSH